MSRAALRFVTGSLLAAVVLWVGAAAASAAEPIEGDWNIQNGVTRVVMTSPGHFEGTVVKPGDGACPDQAPTATVVWRDMTGGGLSYSGSLPWFRTPSCTSIGDGQTTWTLSSNDQG